MRSGMMRCGLVLSLSLQAKIIELRETNKFRTLIFSFHFECARSEVGRQIPISGPKRENIRFASCRLSIKTAIRWVTQKSGETHRIAVGKELSGTRQAGPPSR